MSNIVIHKPQNRAVYHKSYRYILKKPLYGIIDCTYLAVVLACQRTVQSGSRNAADATLKQGDVGQELRDGNGDTVGLRAEGGNENVRNYYPACRRDKLIQQCGYNIVFCFTEPWNFHRGFKISPL